MKKILLVEDNPPTIEIYEKVFRGGGFEIETIKTAYEGLERLKEIREGKKERPDLILLDLILPDVNGIEILKEAKSHPQTRDILVFVLTNYTDPDLTEELFKQKVDKFLVKTNYTPPQLLSLVKEAIK